MKTLDRAPLFGGMALALAVVAAMGCGSKESIASQSAAAFREAQARGESFGGDGLAHGHGATTPGEPGGKEAGDMAGHTGMAMGGTQAGTAPPEHQGMAMGQVGGAPPGHEGMAMGGAQPGAAHQGHAGTAMGGAARGGQQPGHEGMVMGGAHPGAAPQGHAGMAMGGEAPAPPADEPRALSAQPGQTAATLSRDPLDTPAAISVAEARRAAALAVEMGGHGHGGHGGTYRHLDAGRGPGSAGEPQRQPASEPPTDPHQGHDPPSDPPGD